LIFRKKNSKNFHGDPFRGSFAPGSSVFKENITKLTVIAGVIRQLGNTFTSKIGLAALPTFRALLCATFYQEKIYIIKVLFFRKKISFISQRWQS
jgi:hypothetical protein